MSERPRPLTAKDFDASDPEPDRVIKRRNPIGAPLGAPANVWDYHVDKFERQWNATLAEENRRRAEERAAKPDPAAVAAARQAEYDVRAVEQWDEYRRSGHMGALKPIDAWERLVNYEFEHPAYQERAKELMPDIDDG